MSHAGLQMKFGTYIFSHPKKGQYGYYSYNSLRLDILQTARWVTLKNNNNIIIQTIFKLQIPTK